MKDAFEGTCLCAAVRFRGALPSLFCAHCHCEWCRRAHGAAFVTWLGVESVRFAIVAGEDKLRWYASSAQSERGFCTICGSTMFFRSTAAPGEMHIALACIHDEVDQKPSAHVFHDAHVTWFEVRDELPKVDRAHSALAAYAAIPPRPPQD